MSICRNVARFNLAVLISLATVPFGAGLAVAQDFDAGMAAHEATSQTQFVTQQSRISNGMMRDSVRRHRGNRGATSRQQAACRNKGSYRAQYGAGDPKVRRLYSLCRSVGM